MMENACLLMALQQEAAAERGKDRSILICDDLKSSSGDTCFIASWVADDDGNLSHHTPAAAGHFYDGNTGKGEHLGTTPQCISVT